MLGISANKKWAQNNLEVEFYEIFLSHFTNFQNSKSLSSKMKKKDVTDDSLNQIK